MAKRKTVNRINDILKDIDEDILLDVDQGKAVVTDDDYCLLVAGAGAGKTGYPLLRQNDCQCGQLHPNPGSYS